MNILHVLIAFPAALALWFAILVFVDMRKQALKSADILVREARERQSRLDAKKTPVEKLTDFLSSLGWEGPILPLMVGMSGMLVISSVALQFIGIPVLVTLFLGLPVLMLFAGFIASSVRNKRRAMFDTQLTSAFDTIAAQLRQGSSLIRVIEDTYPSFPEPLHSEMFYVVDQVNRGRSVAESLADVAVRYPSNALNLFMAAVKASEERGGQIAPAMEQAAISLREEQELAAEGSADVAMERMQFMGIVILVVFLCVSSVLGADESAAEVYRSPMGLSVLLGATAWFGLGVASVWRMLNSIKGGKK